MYLGATDPKVKARQNIEVRIVKQVVRDALKAGYELSVYDGEERHAPTTDESLLFNQLIETDEDYLHFRKDGKEVGWVFFVYGNDGYDVINDYTTNLDDVLKGANELARQIEENPAK